MSSVKCPHCSFLNFAAAPNCKRCHAPLAYASQQEANAPYTGYGASRNYNYPPPNAYYPQQGGYAPHGGYGPQGQSYAYPPPPYAGMYVDGNGVWQQHGSRLVMDKMAQLPDRCVKCNAYANGQRLRRKLTWHPPALYIALPFSILIYAIVAAIISKKATVHIGLCQQHMKNRPIMIFSSLGLLAFGLVGLLMALVNDSGFLGFIGGGLLLASIVVACIAHSIVRPKKIDDRFVWLTGISSEYLSQLPLWPGMM
ncbi:MAG: hypothetical protein WCB68_00950 [Pyrinomonadaceae bacterium]